MSSSRLFLICLGLLAVLCAVGIGIGVHNSGKDDDAPDQKPWVKSLGHLLDPMTPKLHLPESRWELKAPNFQQTVKVPADDKAKPGTETYRTATFRLVTGPAATVTFKPADGGDGQALQLPRESETGDDRLRGNLAAGAAGGRLVLSSTRPATIELAQ